MSLRPFAVVSDLHANLEAFEAVLDDIDRQGINDVRCTGDIVGYGPDPEKVVDLVIARCSVVISGNHDWALINQPLGFNPYARAVIEHTQKRMKPKFWELIGRRRERWAFIESLPWKAEDGALQFVHGSLRDPLMEYVFGDRPAELWNPGQVDGVFKLLKWICFAGHTHWPVVIRDDKSCWYPSELNGWTCPIEDSRRYIVNVGSVGQPRDGDPRACYAIFTGQEVLYRRVEYAVEKTQRKILANDAIENLLAKRLAVGR